MKISSGDRVRAPDGVLVRELDEEAVILNLDTETYHGLDGVGTRMWAVLTSSPTIAAALAVLEGEYDVDPEVLRRDVLNLVATLAEHRLVDVEAAG